jgi:competence protein ComEC
MERFNLSTGRVAGWVMLSFVIATAVHSAWPYARIPPFVCPILFVACIIPLAVFRSRIVVVSLAVLAAFIFGLWRFDVARIPTIRRIDNHQFLVRKPDGTSPFTRMRQALTSRIHAAMPASEAGLLAGILYGDDDLSTEMRNAFRSAGLTHIVAVSGSNVTVVVQFVSLAALSLGFRRRRAFWITTGILIAFVGFVGFSASVARAAFMGWLVLAARETGRLMDPWRLLLVAATMLLLIDPWQLRYDIGFALSFLAMWGLLAWAPIFERNLGWLPKRFEVRSSAAMTIAATLTTAPYVAWMFGRVPFAGLLTNIVVLPLLPFVMGWGALAAVWGGSAGHEVVAAPVTGLLRVIETVAKLADRVSWLAPYVHGLSFSTMAATYLLLIFLLRLLSDKRGLSTENTGVCIK